jgi:hypothetical protein
MVDWKEVEQTKCQAATIAVTHSSAWIIVDVGGKTARRRLPKVGGYGSRDALKFHHENTKVRKHENEVKADGQGFLAFPFS